MPPGGLLIIEIRVAAFFWCWESSENQYITFFTFRQFVSKVEDDFYVKYERNGKLEELRVQNGQVNLPEVVSPPSCFAEKVRCFRAVDKGPCGCKH